MELQEYGMHNQVETLIFLKVIRKKYFPAILTTMGVILLPVQKTISVTFGNLDNDSQQSFNFTEYLQNKRYINQNLVYLI